jgi:hypothetical protein
MLITDISRSAKLDHVPSIGGNSVDEQQQEIGVASAAQASNRATEKKASGREDISEGPHSSSNVSMDADEGNGRQLGTPTSEATLFESEVSTRRTADTQLIQCPALSPDSNIGEPKKPPMPRSSTVTWMTKPSKMFYLFTTCRYATSPSQQFSGWQKFLGWT